MCPPEVLRRDHSHLPSAAGGLGGATPREDDKPATSDTAVARRRRGRADASPKLSQNEMVPASVLFSFSLEWGHGESDWIPSSTPPGDRGITAAPPANGHRPARRQACALSATEIETRLPRRGGPAARASIYRVLDLLVDRGLAERVVVGEGEARFEPLDPAASTTITSSATSAASSSRSTTRGSSGRSTSSRTGSASRREPRRAAARRLRALRRLAAATRRRRSAAACRRLPPPAPGPRRTASRSSGGCRPDRSRRRSRSRTAMLMPRPRS